MPIQKILKNKKKSGYIDADLPGSTIFFLSRVTVAGFTVFFLDGRDPKPGSKQSFWNEYGWENVLSSNEWNRRRKDQ